MPVSTTSYKEVGNTWSTVASTPVALKLYSGYSSNVKYGSSLVCSHGDNDTNAGKTNHIFNQITWTAAQVAANDNTGGLAAELNSLFYTFGGNNDAGTDQQMPEKWNGTSWASYTALGTASSTSAGVTNPARRTFVSNYGSRGDAATAVALETNISETTSSLTSRAANLLMSCAGYFNSKIYSPGGSTDGDAANATAAVNMFNYTAWAADASMVTAKFHQGTPNKNASFAALGGRNTANATIATQEVFNGATWASATSLPAARQQGGCASL